jgi:hypothetical protein
VAIDSRPSSATVAETVLTVRLASKPICTPPSV